MQSSYTITHATEALARCRVIFEKKLADYGASWRIMRPMSITDQLFIKAKRIRTLECETAMVDEGILPEFMALVNYGIIGLIQLEDGWADSADITPAQALERYNRFARLTLDLMAAKTHDYGDAWREMRCGSFTDLILTKIQRIKQIESNDGATVISEGIDSNLMDIINYAIFAIIKLSDDDCARD